MELSEKDIELVELYKDGLLDEESKVKLEARMDGDPVFKSEVLFCMAIFDSLEMMSISVTRDRIHTLKEETQIKSNNFFDKYKAVFVSLGLIILLLLALFIVRSISSTTEDDNIIFVDSFFEPYPALGILRDNNAERNTTLELYAAGKYKEAIAAWENEMAFRNDKFYLGIAYIATDQPKKALKTLEEIDPNSIDIPANTIQWYIAIAKMKSGDVESAIPLLKTVEPPYVGKADSLMEMIQ